MSKRSITRRLEELENGETGCDGFHSFVITPDTEKGSLFEWNSSKGVYENGDGVEIPPEKAPERAFEYNIEYPDDNKTVN